MSERKDSVKIAKGLPKAMSSKDRRLKRNLKRSHKIVQKTTSTGTKRSNVTLGCSFPGFSGRLPARVFSHINDILCDFFFFFLEICLTSLSFPASLSPTSPLVFACQFTFKSMFVCLYVGSQ